MEENEKLQKDGKRNASYINLKNILFLLVGLCIGALTAAGVSAWIDRSEAGQAGDFPTAGDDRKSGMEYGEEEQEQEEINAQLVELREIEYPAHFYPFSSRYENGRLVLCAESQENTDGLADSESVPQTLCYRIRVFDGNGELIQELPCDIEAGELTFKFDQLFHYSGYDDDLEVFPADAEDTGADGLLFYWDDEVERFSEDPIAIPWYEVVNPLDNAYLVRGREENVETESIYRFSEGTKEPVELRRLVLTYPAEEDEKGHLQIINCVEGVTLYDGEVEFDQLGAPVNNKYYQNLFKMNLEHFFDYAEQEEITVENWTWDGEKEGHEYLVYANREEFLTDFGFAEETPFYEYYDTDQNLIMELWFDERTGRGCGLIHRHRFNYEAGEVVHSYGFAFGHVAEAEWEPEDTFSTLSYYGTDAGRINVSGYREIYAYTDDGKLSSFEARGTVTDYGEGGERGEDSLLFMDYFYRDDGTLFFKRYTHHHILFGSAYQGQSIYYDEQGRPVYNSSYLTSGGREYFYIYEGDKKKPAYCLLIEANGGIIPYMTVYK